MGFGLGLRFHMLPTKSATFGCVTIDQNHSHEILYLVVGEGFRL